MIYKQKLITLMTIFSLMSIGWGQDCSETSGDLNNDNIIDILDIVSTTNCILSDDCNECPDMNDDQIIDIFDILLMVNEIMDTSSDNSIENYIYPISINNNWVYEGDWVISPVSGDSINPYIEDLNFSFTNEVIIDSIYNNDDNIYRFQVNSFEYDGDDEQLSSGYRYFSNDDGLYYHGSDGNSSLVVPWSRESQIFYKINDNLYSLSEFMDLINYGVISGRNECWEESPKLSISYPIFLNDQWIYREFLNDCDNDTEDSNPFRMDKLVIDISDNIFTIQTLYDLDQDSEWDEWIRVFHTYSPNGLINYRVETDNTIMTDEWGNELGTFNSVFSHNLISSEINE